MNTDDKTDYHIKEKRQLHLIDSLTFLPCTIMIEDDKLYALTSRQS